MQTWVDLEIIYGNGEDDFGDVTVRNGIAYPRGGGTQFLALSANSDHLDRFVGFFSVLHNLSPAASLALESVYAFQEGGDLAPLPFAITRDSSIYRDTHRMAAGRKRRKFPVGSRWRRRW
jgi:hypothetical protein